MLVQQVKAAATGFGDQRSPTSPVATTPKIALERGVHVRELRCALCGESFTDVDLETVNGQWSAAFIFVLIAWSVC
jgi:hypothetical protein